ncbi:MAG: hypothetical protein A2W25_12780 [candidate division Zixibacteria bacterium RBG_16_53_22]|nr:MAG: hypothetical protein A2W25_12780 [candidate division Zixibacteria bacterium RBG_16_53_22]
MNKLAGIISVLMFSASCAMAGEGDAGYSGAFMRSGVGARPLGMGGAFTAIAEGPEATYFNPAGLGFEMRLGTSLSYKALSLDRHLGHIAISFPIRSEAVMAASWVNAGVSDIVGRGSSQQIIGNINNNQNAFTLSFGKAINGSAALGASLRYLQEKLDELDVFTIGVDAGFLFRYRELISLGGVVQNLGSTYRWDTNAYWGDGTTYEEKYPVIFKFGLAGNLLDGRVIPAVDFEKSDKTGTLFRAGAEYWFTRKVIQLVEDEYEEGKFNEVEMHKRWAGLRIGIDRGSPTFGGSLAYLKGDRSAAIEYAYLIGQHGTSDGHLFALKLGF